MSAAVEPPPDAERAGRRVEEVLDRLAAAGDREVCARRPRNWCAP